MNAALARRTRVLVVLPSWVGDAVMATPALRAIRETLAGSFLGALARPGIDEVLAGTDFFDEMNVDSRAGVMGVKRAAGKVRVRRYEAALLLTNSFSTAMAVRMAGIPERIGFDRDGRGFLLTTGLKPLRRKDAAPYDASKTDPRAWAPTPACETYMMLARALVNDDSLQAGPLELATTPDEDAGAASILQRAGIDPAREPYAILNPGGNNPAKRWPEDRFIELGHWLRANRGLRILVNGSPSEKELTQRICAGVGDGAASLPELGMRLSVLKAVVRDASLVVTNDTGPRHIAAAFGVPLVTLFGPTDHRWTTIPFEREAILVADPSLPPCEVANDHPERCAIDRVSFEEVQSAVLAICTGETFVQAASSRESSDSSD